jgi:hypothetical protein
MQLQTIEGKELSREEFIQYVIEILQYTSKNKDFNHYQFLYDLRVKCDMTTDEFTAILKEVNQTFNKIYPHKDLSTQDYEDLKKLSE